MLIVQGVILSIAEVNLLILKDICYYDDIYWPITFCSCDTIVSFWYEDYDDLIKVRGKYSPCLFESVCIRWI